MIDKETGEPLIGATVYLDGLDLKTYTDFSGEFKFEGLMAGKYDISASMIAYKKNKLQKYEVKSREGDVVIELEDL
ncbi:MAG: carboxypeptidase-like regulatory domain-containing protein [Bacteroidales bacterium]|nr:carboxypeptidase-like regulatory domain-containing protein [Bacteroidales bacterium]